MLALPIFPGSRPPSIVGAYELNFCVRVGCAPERCQWQKKRGGKQVQRSARNEPASSGEVSAGHRKRGMSRPPPAADQGRRVSGCGRQMPRCFVTAGRCRAPQQETGGRPPGPIT